MEIVQERLEREFDLDLIASAPSVEYHVKLLHGRGEVAIDNPSLLPNPSDIEILEEPWVKQVHEALLKAQEELGVDYKWAESVPSVAAAIPAGPRPGDSVLVPRIAT